MHYDLNSDADLDALFRQAAEMVQTQYESTQCLSADSRLPGAVADQVTPDNSPFNGNTLLALNRPDPLQSDA